jgi:hypothetical protein
MGGRREGWTRKGGRWVVYLLVYCLTDRLGVFIKAPDYRSFSTLVIGGGWPKFVPLFSKLYIY